MKSIPPRVFLCVLCTLCVLRGGEFSAQQSSAPLLEILSRSVPLREGIGRADEPVTTSSPRAQSFYNQGLAYLHSFVWIEAARSFNEALRADTNLAMAHVGLSYALGELGLSAEARAASRRAAALSNQVTERERLRIALRVRQLDAAERPGDTSLRDAYRRQLDQLAAKFPDDVEGLLLVGQAQDSGDDHGMSVGSRSLPFYERALARAPEYFAVHHFLTHALENSERMSDALVHAERYAALASAIPHAHHMYGHVLRRVGRIEEAIAQFESADRLAADFLKAENIRPEYDWHYRHNLNLLGTAYQYRGRMKAAEPILRHAFELESIDHSTQDLNRKDWLMFLLARDRASEALAAARTLSRSTNPLVAALGHIFASRALSGSQPSLAAEEGNTALRQMREIARGGVLVPEYQFAQGEFLQRAGQLENGRTLIREAAAMLLKDPGADAWMQTLFSLELAGRVARAADDWRLADEMAGLMFEYDPHYPGSQYALGLSAEHFGNRADARAAFENAIKYWVAADDDLPERRDAARRLAALR